MPRYPVALTACIKQFFHIWGAESLWWGRLNQNPITISGDPFDGSMENLSASLQALDLQWLSWINGKDDMQLAEKIHYKNVAGQPFHEAYDLLLMHIVNHNTYHNGQLVTMLRALGIDKIPSMDFVAWTRLMG